MYNRERASDDAWELNILRATHQCVRPWRPLLHHNAAPWNQRSREASPQALSSQYNPDQARRSRYELPVSGLDRSITPAQLYPSIRRLGSQFEEAPVGTRDEEAMARGRAEAVRRKRATYALRVSRNESRNFFSAARILLLTRASVVPRTNTAVEYKTGLAPVQPTSVQKP